MKHLKLANIKIVFDHCEALFGYKHEDECMREAHLITCCSTKLEEMTNEQGYTHTAVIKDPSELKTPKNPLVYDDRYEKPKAVYLGMGGNSFLVTEYLKDTIESAGYDLIVISEWDDATVKWDEETWADEMTKCDVALCPQRVDIQPAKSNVKLTAAMPLGLPVLASPIQSYKEIIEHGENGFICETKDQWHEALVKLKDPKTREKIGKAGQEAIKAYALPEITSVWVDTLTKLSNDELSFPEPSKDVAPQKDRELVDIIIASYGNIDYLKMCVNSILLNTGYPFHIIISDAGSGDDTWKYLKTLKGITVLGEKDKRLTYSEACNAGIRASNTKYFVILNSDVVVSRNWLTNMIDKMDSVDRLAACGVLSNCDRGWLHDNSRAPDSPRYKMRLEKAGIELVPGMKMEKIKPHVEELYDFMAQSNEEKKGKFLQQQWVAVYATAFARCAVNEVGLFDPLYKNGCEDLDLCRRLTSYGYNIGQAIDSFVFHFGGLTRASYESENKASYRKEDVENHMKYKAKWEKQRIAIYTGPAWEPWNKEKVDQGMAGSETWASYLAREFVKKGYRCIIYNDLLVDDKTKPVFDRVKDQDGKIYGDVIYRDYRMLQEDIKYDIIDYFISSRTLEPLKNNVHSVRNYVMIHDIWLSPDKNYDIMSWRIQKYGYLSEWHKNFLRMHHGMPEDKMFLTANGVDTSLYADVDSYEKKNRSVYSSSPDRGLFQLLKMLPSIREAVPDFELVVTYGFYNWESSARARGDTDSLAFIEEIKSLMKQDGVVNRGRVSKKELADLQKGSKVLLYPTWFSETFFIGCLDAGFSKNAVLTTDFAGISTTLKDSGVMLPPDGLSRRGEYPASYTNRFVEEAIRLLTDEPYRKEWADKAYRNAQKYTWDKIADRWIEIFEE
jgi:GT2 family glycosyltransferase